MRELGEELVDLACGLRVIRDNRAGLGNRGGAVPGERVRGREPEPDAGARVGARGTQLPERKEVLVVLRAIIGGRKRVAVDDRSPEDAREERAGARAVSDREIAGGNVDGQFGELRRKRVGLVERL